MPISSGRFNAVKRFGLRQQGAELDLPDDQQPDDQCIHRGDHRRHGQDEEGEQGAGAQPCPLLMFEELHVGSGVLEPVGLGDGCH